MNRPIREPEELKDLFGTKTLDKDTFGGYINPEF